MGKINFTFGFRPADKEDPASTGGGCLLIVKIANFNDPIE
jgi:hypothetical protein